MQSNVSNAGSSLIRSLTPDSEKIMHVQPYEIAAETLPSLNIGSNKYLEEQQDVCKNRQRRSTERKMQQDRSKPQ